MEDREIIKLFQMRSEQAIDELARKYGAACTQVAHNILNDRQDAEECVNDAYLGAWNTIPPEEPNPLAAYVYRIVRNLALKRYHANTAAKRNSVYDVALEELEGCLPCRDTVEGAYQAQELAQAIDRFLQQTDQDSRALFVRRYWYADSIGELARRFRTSPHNVSVRLHRIRGRLKKFLIGEGVML